MLFSTMSLYGFNYIPKWHEWKGQRLIHKYKTLHREYLTLPIVDSACPPLIVELEIIQKYLT